MERIGDITGILSLLLVAAQDFRSRRIAWWLLPLFAAGSIMAFFAHGTSRDFFRLFSVNIIFLILQFLFLLAWYWIRNKKFTRIIDVKLGLGDVLFLICSATMFSPVNFIVVYTLSMIFSLLICIYILLSRKTTTFEIPLAGLLALPLILLCTWRLVNPSLDFYSDEWLIAFFEKNN